MLCIFSWEILKICTNKAAYEEFYCSFGSFFNGNSTNVHIKGVFLKNMHTDVHIIDIITQNMHIEAWVV
ncbi:hypothetical protein D1841_18095 [Neglecta sp. X4]|uniref:Uncharacterized protein n=1 Tax=Anaerotruncus colihominis TaxID=169435 RepID=A0A845QG26_9FIRM|nr:hypothetical protein [Anaerotruncus colihominis]NBJ75036.1 hypothetical protein [Neglectibacter sp. X4]NCF01525.1 hypothetical protein [Anaerotruncus sp. 80]